VVNQTRKERSGTAKKRLSRARTATRGEGEGLKVEDFGQEVKKFLKFHDMRQWQLARKVGIDPAHLSKLLTGWFPLREVMRQRILKAMKELSERKTHD